MKELISIAYNTSLVNANNGLVPFVELIVITSEPEYSIADKEIKKARKLETIRFGAMKHNLSVLIAQLGEVMADLDKLEQYLPNQKDGKTDNPEEAAT